MPATPSMPPTETAALPVGGPRRRRRRGGERAAPARAVTVGATALQRPQQRRGGVRADESGDEQRRDDDAGAQRRAARGIREQVGLDRDERRRGGRQVRDGSAERGRRTASSTHARRCAAGAASGGPTSAGGDRARSRGCRRDPDSGSRVRTVSGAAVAADGIHRLVGPLTQRAPRRRGGVVQVHPLKVQRRRRAILIGTTTGVR